MRAVLRAAEQGGEEIALGAFRFLPTARVLVKGDEKIRLTDFKVRDVDSGEGTAAKVRTIVEWTADHGATWSTVGVSENIIEASWQALVDAVEYGLLKEKEPTK